MNGQASHAIGLQGLKSLCENSRLPRFCSARLQAGTLESTRCPPEGGRYMNQNRVRTQILKPLFFRLLNVAAEAATYKDHL